MTESERLPGERRLELGRGARRKNNAPFGANSEDCKGMKTMLLITRILRKSTPILMTGAMAIGLLVAAPPALAIQLT